MFWRDRERDTKEQNGGPPCGQVRVLVVGDSGISFSSSFFPVKAIGCVYIYIYVYIACFDVFWSHFF